MKTKLTISIEKALIPKAKQYARAQGCSLSHLVEESLKAVTANKGESFSEKWRGKFTEARRPSVRYEHLAKKYL